ncbi:hypothetical protein MMC17_004354 [Xylographa soralifera]|nr:hypothetical protein [Xylographa soralifera]
MPTAVVTGANSGIGNALTKILISEKYEVYACDINISPSLESMGARPITLDVTDQSSVTSLKARLSDRPLDILFNVAGRYLCFLLSNVVYLTIKLLGIMPPKSEDTLEAITSSLLVRTFSTNAFGPLLLTQALLPNLLASKSPRVYNVSSRVGSIADNSSGGAFAYRSSKAALNAISKSMAVDLKDKGVIVLILHPGIVKTGLDPTSHKMDAAVEPEVAAKELWEVCKSKGMEESGRFWHRTGEELPW